MKRARPERSDFGLSPQRFPHSLYERDERRFQLRHERLRRTRMRRQGEDDTSWQFIEYGDLDALREENDDA